MIFTGWTTLAEDALEIYHMGGVRAFLRGDGCALQNEPKAPEKKSKRNSTSHRPSVITALTAGGSFDHFTTSCFSRGLLERLTWIGHFVVTMLGVTGGNMLLDVYD